MSPRSKVSRLNERFYKNIINITVYSNFKFEFYETCNYVVEMSTSVPTP